VYSMNLWTACDDSSQKETSYVINNPSLSGAFLLRCKKMDTEGITNIGRRGILELRVCLVAPGVQG
jgi:hypothetical protein